MEIVTFKHECRVVLEMVLISADMHNVQSFAVIAQIEHLAKLSSLKSQWNHPATTSGANFLPTTPCVSQFVFMATMHAQISTLTNQSFVNNRPQYTIGNRIEQNNQSADTFTLGVQKIYIFSTFDYYILPNTRFIVLDILLYSSYVLMYY